MKKIGIIGFLVLGLMVQNPSFSAPKTNDEKTTTQMASVESVEKLFHVMGMEEAQKKALEMVLQNQLDRDPCLQPFTKITRDFLIKIASFEALKKELLNIYVTDFTENEIEEMITLFSTPMGKKFMEKFPILVAKGQELVLRNIQEHMTEFQNQISEKASAIDPNTVPEACKAQFSMGVGGKDWSTIKP